MEKELCRKKYYVEEFNPTCDLQQKYYIEASILRRAEILISQLKTSLHQLRYEMRRWKIPRTSVYIMHIRASGPID